MNPAASHDATPLPVALAWTDFLGTRGLADACDEWLDRLIATIGPVRRAAVLLRTEQETLEPIAAVPSKSSVADLVDSLQRATTAAGCESRTLADGGRLLTAPLMWDGRLGGLALLDIAEGVLLDRVLVPFNASCGWLVALLGRRAQEKQQFAVVQARRLLALISVAMAESRFPAAALALANRLSVLWEADSVSIGWVEAQRTSLIARSNAAQSDERANLVHLVVAAMDEALDERRTLHWHLQEADDGPGHEFLQHRALARETQARAVATSLLFEQGVAVGAVTVMRGRGFSASELESLDTQCMVLAPLLTQRRAADRSVWQHAVASARSALRQGTDASHLGWKSAAAFMVLLLVLAAIVPVPFRLTAPSVVEGEVQRTIAAPFQGYIRQARVRAGDVVHAGDVMATLEDKDLQLDRSRWSAEVEVAQRKEREAMAAGNRVEVRLAAAQGNQAGAQLELTQEKLKRIQITAPFDGVVVHGDLSQQIGSPVEQGKLLFELAPLDAWRVILKVDERDIGHLQLHQHGEVLLAGLSGSRQPFTVSRTTSIAVAEDGRNYFRVEASLAHHDVKLRPGMEGVAKIDAGSASALWVATRRLTNWLRLMWWEWAP